MSVILSELLELLRTTNFDSYESGLYEDVMKNPENYNISYLGERKDVKKIGDHIIPPQGKIIFFDNDFFELQSSEFKSLYSELNIQKPAAIVEIIECVDLIKGTDKVELTIRKFLIQEK